MIIHKKRRVLVQFSVIGCNYCGKPIGNSNMVTLTLKRMARGINGRRQWETKKESEKYHKRCFQEKFNTHLIREEV